MQTFEPLNEATRIRIAEVDFRRSTFEGRSVLDVGANSGLLSIQACLNGAERVTSIDVTPKFIGYLEDILEVHDLPMTVRKQAVAELDPSTDVHDVVLFFEVIHWTTAQGMPIPVAIEKVANVTGETLLIEFPWDIREPSIVGQTNLTIDEYDSSIIIEELSARFHDLSFDRFMSYFRGQVGSRRALMTAQNPKLSPAFFDVPKFRPAIEQPISQGENSSAYVRADETNYFLKAFPSWTALSTMPIELVERFLRGMGEGPLLDPLEMNGRVVTQLGPRRVLAYPWLGGEDGSVDFSDRPSVSDALDLARQTIVQLSRIDSALVEELAAAGLSSVPFGEELVSLIRQEGDSAGLSATQVEHLSVLAMNTPRSTQLRLIHGDLHRSNMVSDADRGFVVSDLDTLMVGGPYTDLYWQVGFQALEIPEATAHLSALQAMLDGDAPETSDALGALGLLLGWFSSAAGSARVSHLDRVRAGVQLLITFAEVDA